MTSIGIRYSNIEPLHESSTGSPPVAVSKRPSANQLSCGTWPWAMATKLHRRASEATGRNSWCPAGMLGDVVADGQQMARFVVEEVVCHVGEFAGLQSQSFNS
jgi:hypothetical protein